MKNKAPAVQWYPGDWLSDPRVRCLTRAERADYFDLLNYMWMEEDCGLPSDLMTLSRMLGYEEGKNQLENIIKLFIAHPTKKEKITQKRLLKEREKQKKFKKEMSKAGVRGNNKRWGKAKNASSPSDRVGDKKSIASDRSPSPSSTTERKESPSEIPKEKTPAEIAKEFFDHGPVFERALEYLTSDRKVPAQLAKDQIAAFVEYWTEPTKNGKKMRWETEKTFEVGRRLSKWLGNVPKFQGSVRGSPPLTKYQQEREQFFSQQMAASGVTPNPSP